MTVVVCDTSVLSYLALIEQFHLLPKLFGYVTIPSTVLAECLHPDAPELLHKALTPTPPSFAVMLAGGPNIPETATLAPGEAEAISITWQHRADSLLLIDEKQGRAIASQKRVWLPPLISFISAGQRPSPAQMASRAGCSSASGNSFSTKAANAPRLRHHLRRTHVAELFSMRRVTWRMAAFHPSC